MGWKYHSGIVTTSHAPVSTFLRRIFYVTYERGHVHRTIMASFVYTKIETFDKEKFVECLMEEPENLNLESMDVNLKVVKQSCSVGSITDFDIYELSQLPQDPKDIEDIYEVMTDEPEDSEDQYWTRKHFEKYIVICDVSECVCTLTEDEESRKRINEILGERGLQMEKVETTYETIQKLVREKESAQQIMDGVTEVVESEVVEPEVVEPEVVEPEVVEPEVVESEVVESEVVESEVVESEVVEP